MGSDGNVNWDRLTLAFEKLAREFDRYNTLYLRRLLKEYPPERVKRAPEIISAESEREAAMSDRPTPEWLRETEAAVPEPSRFQKRFDKAKPPTAPTEPRRRRITQVPKKH